MAGPSSLTVSQEFSFVQDNLESLVAVVRECLPSIKESLLSEGFINKTEYSGIKSSSNKDETAKRLVDKVSKTIKSDRLKFYNFLWILSKTEKKSSTVAIKMAKEGTYNLNYAYRIPCTWV